jgi:hypothetical protein
LNDMGSALISAVPLTEEERPTVVPLMVVVLAMDVGSQSLHGAHEVGSTGSSDEVVVLKMTEEGRPIVVMLDLVPLALEVGSTGPWGAVVERAGAKGGTRVKP